MGTRSNYDDNLFFLQSWLKTLRMSLKLELDPELFLHKSLDIVLFIHETLARLHQKLVANTQYIHRLEHLRLLLLAKKDFLIFLDELNRPGTDFLEQLASCRDQLDQCRAIHERECGEIEDILDASLATDAEETDIISTDEYHFLFKDTED